MVVSNNPALDKRVRFLQQYGWRERYVSEIPGGNSRLDELQAAILREKLHYLDAENQRRGAIAERYTTSLSGSSLSLPICRVNSRHVYHQYVVSTPHRDSLQAYLRARGISTLVHYPRAVHQQPAYQGRLPIVGSLQNSEHAVSQVLSLPIFPELQDEQVEAVAQACRIWGQG